MLNTADGFRGIEEWTLNAGTVVRHFKGGLYMVISVAQHTESGEKLVIYKSLDGTNRVWARPYNMFAQIIIDDEHNETGQVFRFVVYSPGGGQHE